ncbi:MAG: beta-galactosidase [Acidobacteria bacterium]|nr:beta-galactosidase [Acidobacteriota bacterium]
MKRFAVCLLFVIMMVSLPIASLAEVWIGVHYEYPFGGMMADRPEWIPKGAKDWRRDLQMIKDTGFDLIRIRVGLDSDIDDIATLLDISHELDIKVEFGSAMFYVSNEFVRKYPDSKMIMANGEKIPRDELDYRWPRACIHHPVFRTQRNQFFEQCARRFKDHPAIIAWDIHNEPSFSDCRCDNTLAVYRRAVEKEFGDVEHYNRRFSTSFAGLKDVVPPKERSENVEAYRYWRAFLTAELNRFLNELRDIIRKHVSELPITYNPTDVFSISRYSQDWWNLRRYELMSCSYYPGSGEHTPGTAVQLEILKAFGPGKDRWIAEFQGGPFSTGGRLYNGKQMALELNAALAHNMKGVIFYRWDPLLNGPEPWINGIIGVDTYDTERRLTLKKGIAELREYRDILKRGRSIAPSVGIFLKRDHAVHSSELGYDIRQAMDGNYSMLSALGYEAAVLLDEFDPAKCPYDVMIFPYMYIDADLAGAIRQYARSGKRAIVELPVQDIDAAKSVGKQFGLGIVGHEKPDYFFNGWDLRGTGEEPGVGQGRFAGFAAHERLLLDATGQKVLLTYGLDGRPAVVAPAEYGGNVLVFGFPLGRTHFAMLHQDLRNFVGAFIGRKVQPDIVLKGVPDEYRAMVEARVIETDNEGLLFVINRSLYDYDLEVAVKGYQPIKTKAGMYSVIKERLK